MKYSTVKRCLMIIAFMSATAGMLAGCGNTKEADAENISSSADMSEAENSSNYSQVLAGQSVEAAETAVNSSDGEIVQANLQDTELEVRFGDDGEPFMMHMENNVTAQAIVRYVGTSDWRLPIYDRDDDVDYSVMQYYDIPDRYEIPAEAETVSEAKAGEVFYSDPNRIVLYYHDAQISEEYTRIGSFDVTDEFISAVENNPVLEGWGNKIVQISRP